MRNKNGVLEVALYAVLSKYCVGKRNAKNRAFIAQKMMDDYGVKMNTLQLPRALANHPLAGFTLNGRHSKIYLVTTHDEAKEVINALETRANTSLQRANALRDYFNITQ